MYTEYTIIYIHNPHIIIYVSIIQISIVLISSVACFPNKMATSLQTSNFIYFHSQEGHHDQHKIKRPLVAGHSDQRRDDDPFASSTSDGWVIFFPGTTNKTINGLQLDFNPTVVYWGIVHL